jgi:peptide/nickel transport system substrate-binding protein
MPFPTVRCYFLTYIVSKKMEEENNAVRPVDRRKGIENVILQIERHGTFPTAGVPNFRCSGSFVRNAASLGKIEGSMKLFTRHRKMMQREWQLC